MWSEMSYNWLTQNNKEQHEHHDNIDRVNEIFSLEDWYAYINYIDGRVEFES